MKEEYPDFIYLTVDEVKEIHKAQLEMFGGLSGIRNLSGLKSAVEQPKQKKNKNPQDNNTSNRCAVMIQCQLSSIP
jgi:prophage maintenance system killer protein